MSKRSKSTKARIQHAALPYRRHEDNTRFEVLLVTSRETRRWVIPKGWPMRGYKGRHSAAQEAFEEAGLDGQVARRPIGTYTYNKRLKDGAEVACSVRVYPFAVASQRQQWPEMNQREARWFSFWDAAGAVVEPELAALIIRFENNVGRAQGTA